MDKLTIMSTDSQPETPYRAELQLIVQRAFSNTERSTGGTRDKSAKRQEALVKYFEKIMIDSSEFDARDAESLVEEEARLKGFEHHLRDREKDVVERERALPKRESDVAKREYAVGEREQGQGRPNLALPTGPYIAPEYIRWSSIVKHQKIILDETCLTARCGPWDDRAVVMGTHPLPPDRIYFEVLVTKRAFKEVIGIGFTKEVPVLIKMPGWTNYESFGYHGDDGKIFAGTDVGRLTYEKYSQGDVVGCGVDNQTECLSLRMGNY